MSTINERVKAVRNAFNMNQSDFGKKLAVSQNYLSNIEKGYRDVTEKILKILCLEFNVNENWLRTGEGKMFNEVTKDDLLTTALANAINDNDMFLQGFITTYDKLPEDGKKLITNFIKELANVANLCEEEESNKKEED